MTSKIKSAESAALALLGVGAREQSARMPQRASEPKKAKPQQVNIQLTPEGLAMLRQAQVKLLQRGVPRASFRGVVLETVLRDWLEGR